jgi:cellulose synthase/poly-beta-1,6-N-acetylglucosamine synthase-like glycosyltransferase
MWRTLHSNTYPYRMWCVVRLQMKERGKLFRWIFWKIVEIFVILFSSISFLISWLQYRRLSHQYQSKKSTCVNNNVPKLSKEKGKLSIIIAIKNEAKHIGKTIRNFESTTIDKSAVEIILVDSGCKDNSLEVARVSSSFIFPFSRSFFFISFRHLLVLSQSNLFVVPLPTKVVVVPH